MPLGVSRRNRRELTDAVRDRQRDILFAGENGAVRQHTLNMVLLENIPKDLPWHAHHIPRDELERRVLRRGKIII